MRAYQKPQITKVALRPEEQLLTGCKMHKTAGPFKGGKCASGGDKCGTTAGS